MLEIDHVSDSAAPPESKTIPQMKYLDTNASQYFFGIFSENIFSQYFPKFWTPQHPKFRDLADPAIRRYGHIAGSAKMQNTQL